MIDFALIDDVCDQLYAWHVEGKNLPSYETRMGKPHLYWLLIGKLVPKDGSNVDVWIRKLRETMTEDCARGLLSQHGWCIYQVLLARRGVKEETS